MIIRNDNFSLSPPAAETVPSVLHVHSCVRLGPVRWSADRERAPVTGNTATSLMTESLLLSHSAKVFEHLEKWEKAVAIELGEQDDTRALGPVAFAALVAPFLRVRRSSGAHCCALHPHQLQGMPAAPLADATRLHPPCVPCI